MTSMGDLGREIDDIRDHPIPAHPETELDRLEARLQAFFEWAPGRPHPEIREKFASDFSAEPLHDDVVHELSEGRGSAVRDRLPVAAGEDDAPGDSSSLS